MKTAGKYLAAFCICAALLSALLVGTALIPREAIADNMRESAGYLASGDVFPVLVQGVESSRIDRYADAILLNIAWHYDAARPLESVMRSAYYYTGTQNENLNLRDAVTDGPNANRQYLRYWHGSLALVRPALTVLNIRQLYALNAALLALLAVCLLALLRRRGERAAAAGVLAGLIAAAVWFVPLSLEYTWTFLLTLAVSVFAVLRSDDLRDPCLLFLLIGMATSFLDFLTTETLTLTLPLLLLLWLRRKDETAQPVQTAWTSALAWGCGYAGMWALKWLLAGAALGENVLPYITESVETRISGAVDDAGQLSMAAQAVWRNLSCLFPLDWGFAGVLAALALLVGAAYYGYVYRRPGADKKLILTCAAVGLVPFIRYLTLRNHSHIHFFFTYRAQAATMLALVLILAELTERRRADAPKRRKHA